MLRSAIACILFITICCADDIYLKTGFVMRNVQIIDTTGSTVNIRRDGKAISIAMEDILRIEYRQLPANQKSSYEMFSSELYEQYQKSLPEREKLARERQLQKGAVSADSSKGTNSTPTWFNAGIGAAFVAKKTRQALSIGIGLSHLWGEHLFSVRFVHNVIPHFGFGTDDVTSDIAALYGRGSSSDIGFASVSAGIAYVGGDESSLGVPLEIQLFWTPTSFLGIGLYAFGNLNQVRSFAGALFTIQLGSPRRKSQ